jgi:hypothetical protein
MKTMLKMIPIVLIGLMLSQNVIADGGKKFQILVDSIDIANVIENSKTIILDEIFNANSAEEELTIEPWMMDPYYFEESSEELTIEPWMLDTDYFNK